MRPITLILQLALLMRLDITDRFPAVNKTLPPVTTAYLIKAKAMNNNVMYTLEG